MKKAFCYLQPFAAEQKIYVCEGKDIVAQYTVSIKGLPHTIRTMLELHDVQQLNLAGDKEYAAAIKNNLEEKNRAYYSAKHFTINII